MPWSFNLIIAPALLILLALPLMGQPALSKKQKKAITTYILVRHAEKADDGTKDPPLSEIGKERAERLARQLGQAEVSAIYSTNYQRTKQTVQPLANKNNLEVSLYDPFAEEALANMQQAARGKTVLIVGHSNTVPAMVNQLLGEERYEQLTESEYDKIYIVSSVKKQTKVMMWNY